MFSVGLDVDTLVSKIMVTLFLSLGLYAGKLDYNFGPLSLKYILVTLALLRTPTNYPSAGGQGVRRRSVPGPEGDRLQSIKSQGRRLFGKIQNLYYKFNFALTAKGSLPFFPSSLREDPCPVLYSKAEEGKKGKNGGGITKLKFKNEQSAGNSLFRLPPFLGVGRVAPGRELLPLQQELQSNLNLISPWSGSLAEKYHISDHLIKHKKPSCGPFYPQEDQRSGGMGFNNVDFGYYLSGLIEGNGLFEDHKLEIKFSEKDISLAYYLKKEIGYGKVIKEKNLSRRVRRAGGAKVGGGENVKYVLVHSEGLKKVLNLLNGKLININTINQLLTHKYDAIFNINILPPANFDITSNYWLTGFIDAKGYFSINSNSNSNSNSLALSRRRLGAPCTSAGLGDNKDSLNLEFYIKINNTLTTAPSETKTKNQSQNQILNQNQNQNQIQNQKADYFFILNVIKKTFGDEGNEGENIYFDPLTSTPCQSPKSQSRGNYSYGGQEGKESKQTIVYKTSDVKSIKLIIDYLDKFQLISYKHVKFFQ